MKRLLTLALFAVLMLPAVAQELTVATYNIRNANKGDAERGNGWERRCPWVCGLIEFQGFDIFGSQEVLDGQLHDMLAQLPGYAYIGVGRDDGKAKGEYSPIFYKKERFRLLDEGHFWLSEVTDRPNKGWDAALPRICTWGHFLDRQHAAPKNAAKNTFFILSLHLNQSLPEQPPQNSSRTTTGRKARRRFPSCGPWTGCSPRRSRWPKSIR